MDKQSIHPDKQYAIRERRSPDEPFQRVKVIEPVRSGNWRVEWINPNPGLVDSLPSKAFICPWGERQKYLADERRQLALSQACDRQSPGADHPIERAASTVIDSAGEMSVCLWKGELTGDPDAVRRIAERANHELSLGPHGFVDRHGSMHFAFQEALDLAKALAAAEPGTVLTHVELDERELEVRVKEPDGAYLLSMLEEHRAEWAIIRQWAGVDQQLRQLHDEIDRLRKLIQRITWDLRQPGADPEHLARTLERAVHGK